MSVTVRRFASLPGLGLRLLTDVGVDREVRWAAVSELDDPTAFLEGGELLLTTGMNLATTPQALGAYLDRLVAADVAAFGLGTGPGLTHQVPPEGLAAAGAARGLPVVEVPHGTPFIAVTRALAERLAAAQRDELAAALRVQRRLVDAALIAQPHHAVLNELAQAVGGWAALVDPSGGLVHAWPDTSDIAQAVADLGDDVRRLTSRGLHASAALDIAGATVVAQPIGTAGRVTGVLLTASAQRFTPERRSLIAVAVAVLSLERDPDAARAAGSVRSALASLLVGGHLEDAVVVADAAELPLPSEPVRVVVVTSDDPSYGATLAADVLEATESAYATSDGADWVAVLSSLNLDSVQALVLATPGTYGAASGQGALADVPALVRQARLALDFATQGERRWGDADTVGALQLLQSVPASVARAHAEHLLQPLAGYGRDDDLVRTLRAWLTHNGHGDRAAQALGVHRNTLRYRIRRIEELTGRSLASMPDRVDFWLALSVSPT